MGWAGVIIDRLTRNFLFVRTVLVAMAVLAAPTALAHAQSPAQEPHVHQTGPTERLGTVHFDTSCQKAAQAPFDRAVALLHSFEFGTAIDGFEAALKIDPGCAMTQWGIALSHWSNPFSVNQRSARIVALGLAAVDRG